MTNKEILEAAGISSYSIERELFLGGLLIRQIQTPDGSNTKITVHDETCFQVLNPYFGRPNSPVACFEPTERGWSMAIQFASTYVN